MSVKKRDSLRLKDELIFDDNYYQSHILYISLNKNYVSCNYKLIIIIINNYYY